MIRRELRDERVVDFRMVPQRIVPSDQLLLRAQRLRDRSRQGVVPESPTRPSVNRRTPPPAPRTPVPPQVPSEPAVPLRPQPMPPLSELPR